jgi:hypothetical protein
MSAVHRKARILPFRHESELTGSGAGGKGLFKVVALERVYLLKHSGSLNPLGRQVFDLTVFRERRTILRAVEPGAIATVWKRSSWKQLETGWKSGAL